MGDYLDLRKQLTFYGSYHSNDWNKAIHIVFVPLIYWTSMVFASYTGTLFAVDVPSDYQYLVSGREAVHFSLAEVGSLGYFLYYLALERGIGALSTSILFVVACTTAHEFVATTTSAMAWKWAFFLHVVSWVFQFIGHGVFEGKRPALTDSLVQSLVLAPLFVYLEVLHELFGYRSADHKAVVKAVAQKKKVEKRKD